MTTFCLLAAQDPANQWLEDNPQVLGGIILVAAVLNLLFALFLLLAAFIATRMVRKKLPLPALLAL
jgi:hypothetical protein